MKRRVLQSLTLLFVSMFIITPVMAHTFDDVTLPDPSAVAIRVVDGYLDVMQVINVWDPDGTKNTKVGYSTVSVTQNNHDANFEHDDIIGLRDLGKALEITENRFPTYQGLSNFRGTIKTPHAIKRINSVLNKYDTLPFYTVIIGKHGAEVLENTRAMLYDLKDVSKNGGIDFVDLIVIANQLRDANFPHFGVSYFGYPDGWPDTNRDAVIDTIDMTEVAKELTDRSVAAAKTALASAELHDIGGSQVTIAKIDLWLADSAVKASVETQEALNSIKAALTPDADVDLNGTIGFEDLLYVCNAVMGTFVPGTLSDANRDNRVDVDDILFVAGKLSPIDETQQRLFNVFELPMLKIKPVFTYTEIEAWKQQATGDTATVLEQTRRAMVIAWMDVDFDGDIDFQDLIKVGNAIHGDTPDGVNPDVNRSGGAPDVDDIIFVASGVSEGDTSLQVAQDAVRSTPPKFTAADVEPWIANAKGLFAPNLHAVLRSLKEAIETTGVAAKAPQSGEAGSQAPKQTELFANYPNPFNPETWIPYQLATSAEVSIVIYAADGREIRKLNIGHLPAGKYYEKHRAAYWDGKNAQGEPVASGLYFYTFTAGEFTATQKMLIRK